MTAQLPRAQTVPSDVLDHIAFFCRFAYQFFDKHPTVRRDLSNASLVCRNWRSAFQKRLCAGRLVLRSRKAALTFLASDLPKFHSVRHLCISIFDPPIIVALIHHLSSIKTKNLKLNCAASIGLTELEELELMKWHDLQLQLGDPTPIRLPNLHAFAIGHHANVSTLHDITRHFVLPGLRHLEIVSGANDDPQEYLVDLLRTYGASLYEVRLEVTNPRKSFASLMDILTGYTHLYPSLRTFELKVGFTDHKLTGDVDLVESRSKAFEAMMQAWSATTALHVLRLWLRIKTEHQLDNWVGTLEELVGNRVQPHLKLLRVRIFTTNRGLDPYPENIPRGKRSPLFGVRWAGLQSACHTHGITLELMGAISDRFNKTAADFVSPSPALPFMRAI